MKKFTIISTLAIAVSLLFVACKSNVAPVPQTMTDTTGFAQFQEWKLLNAEKENQQAAVARQTSSRMATRAAKTVSMNSSTTNEAKVAKKKGWSKSAKYAVIGGAGGAVLGAVINKKAPVKGAVIGAVILGGGGYIFGRSKDKKEGRY